MAVAQAGGRILAGADSPITPYGLSLHAELRMFVEAGMTPFQALQTVTTTAAEVLGAEKDFGGVAVGKLADFVLVEGNPLEDIASAMKVRTVVKNGEVLERRRLLGGRGQMS